MRKYKFFLTTLLQLCLGASLVLLLAQHCPPTVSLENLYIDDGFLHLQVHRYEDDDTYTLKVADNFLFIGSETMNIEKDAVQLPVDYETTVYVKVTPSDEIFDFLTSSYKIKVHEHSDDVKSTLSIPAFLCVYDGLSVYGCSDCDEMHSELIPKMEHTLELLSSSDGSCIELAKDEYVCTVCFSEIEQTYIYGQHHFVCSVESSRDTLLVSEVCSACQKLYKFEFLKNNYGKFLDILFIPELDICIPVYFSSNAATSQLCTDLPDSAAKINAISGTKPLICDHYYQANFTNIRNAVIGSTVLYYGDDMYMCSENTTGTNVRTDLLYDAGGSVFYGPSDLYLYTCNSNSGIPIQVVGWNLVNS